MDRALVRSSDHSICRTRKLSMEMNHHELIGASQPDVPAAAVQSSKTQIMVSASTGCWATQNSRLSTSASSCPSRPLGYRMRFSMRQDEQPGMSVVTKLFGGEDLGRRIGAVMHEDQP